MFDVPGYPPWGPSCSCGGSCATCGEQHHQGTAADSETGATGSGIPAYTPVGTAAVAGTEHFPFGGGVHAATSHVQSPCFPGYFPSGGGAVVCGDSKAFPVIPERINALVYSHWLRFQQLYGMGFGESRGGGGGSTGHLNDMPEEPSAPAYPPLEVLPDPSAPNDPCKKLGKLHVWVQPPMPMDESILQKGKWKKEQEKAAKLLKRAFDKYWSKPLKCPCPPGTNTDKSCYLKLELVIHFDPLKIPRHVAFFSFIPYTDYDQFAFAQPSVVGNFGTAHTRLPTGPGMGNGGRVYTPMPGTSIPVPLHYHGDMTSATGRGLLATMPGNVSTGQREPISQQWADATAAHEIARMLGLLGNVGPMSSNDRRTGGRARQILAGGPDEKEQCEVMNRSAACDIAKCCEMSPPPKDKDKDKNEDKDKEVDGGPFSIINMSIPGISPFVGAAPVDSHGWNGQVVSQPDTARPGVMWIDNSEQPPPGGRFAWRDGPEGSS